MNKLRIAWLLTSAFYYWHPMLSCMAKLFPQMRAFAANWRGYAPGFEDSFQVEVVGERKVIPIIQPSTGYGYSFTFLPLNIVNRLLQFKPDIIFSNSFGIWTLLALLFKPLGKWKVVIAYEGSSPSIDCKNSALRLSLRRLMVSLSDACITNSQAGKRYLTEVLNSSAAEVFVHPYEVPSVDSLSEKRLVEFPSLLQKLEYPIFIFVGGIIPRKGLRFLLEACAILQEQGCDHYKLLILGDGLQRLELEKFSEEKGLANRILWLGRVDYAELGPYFAKADVFVLPTLEDTWGMVVLEAMILGKPILCSKWAGASELVIEGENGYCFDPYEPEQLAHLMRLFIENQNSAMIMGKNSKDLMEKYTPEKAAHFLFDVISTISED